MTDAAHLLSRASQPSTSTSLYFLLLAEDGSPEVNKTYIRIPLGSQACVLRFALKRGSKAATSKEPALYTTYPTQGPFDRSTSHKLTFSKDGLCDVELSTPGVYDYHVSYGSNTRGKTGHFVVEPRLYHNGSQLPLDAVMIESLIPKWMGPLSNWQPHIDLVRKTGYNMIHFAPMQQRGGSDSPYAIHDQLLFADGLFEDNQLPREERLKEVRQVLFKIQHEDDIICLSDVVWNHTSYDSPFLKDHPEAGYNLDNSPHLRPAYELDTALWELSNNLTTYGLPTVIQSEKDVDIVMAYIKDVIFPNLKLWEYKVVDVKSALEKFTQALQEGVRGDDCQWERAVGLSIDEQAELLKRYAICGQTNFARFSRSVNIPHAISFISSFTQADNLTSVFRKLLDQVNLVYYQEYDDDVLIALRNIRSRIIYSRLDPKGPKLVEISRRCPIVESYFTRIGEHALANNGWIWGADPLEDFAGPDSSAYLRRQVIAWGDCVKLRYGKSVNDNPWLWNHMREYTEQVASLFNGVRIDNCHSTPLHVAEYLLDCARRVRPDLYVVAELFTGSEEKDLLFVSRLGIHALIREAMQVWDPHELSRLIHRHGGKPVGSMDQSIQWKKTFKDGKAYTLIPVEHGSQPRALFMDCTHDNETPHQRRTAEDTLSNAALVSFSNCATGSVKGYDELYPHLLDVVKEKRQYMPLAKESVGIVNPKRKLQELHTTMALEGYDEVHVHHEGDYILVHRQHPDTHDGYLLVARTAFPERQGSIAPIRLHRTKLRYLFGASLQVDKSSCMKDGDDQYLMGVPSTLLELGQPHISEESDSWKEIHLGSAFAPGSIYVFRTIAEIPKDVTKLVTDMPASVTDPLDVIDCNIILYRCESEERDATGDGGVYDVPRWGKAVYAGLEGFMALLRPIIRDNDLGHPFCDNLRAGFWALDYVQNRLRRYSDENHDDVRHLQPLIDWFQSCFAVIKTLPNFLVPKYFSMAIHTAYEHVRDRALRCFSPFVYNNLDPFVHSLALVSVQMLGRVPSTSLVPHKTTASLAAGLPHFAHGYMRTWGRDVFISLRGLLMVTGELEAAKEHILSFGATCYHGLLPNLLDAGRNPRFNARDAVWFFLQAVQDYCSISKSTDILQESIKRRFTKDYEYVPVEQGYTWECTLAELIQEIMEQHAAGIHFREHNAGTMIDSQMTSQGFNIDIDVDWSSGVLVGGNIWNCGTWMDKMGESAKAGNKGHPGTSRDGAPIEITGLLKSALRWILELNQRGLYPWHGVQGKCIRLRRGVLLNELICCA
ncbi:glucanotransferase domain of glycogen debranching enzyme-domain-containing protein [Dichotomocladium elegans]|nr:glucanotransferase domain of glycogen debranching enzyme-domain-containing protein [Dichotomocladium elegans]